MRAEPNLTSELRSDWVEDQNSNHHIKKKELGHSVAQQKWIKDEWLLSFTITLLKYDANGFSERDVGKAISNYIQSQGGSVFRLAPL